MEMIIVNGLFILVGLIGIGCLFFVATKIDAPKRKEDKRKIYESTLLH